MKHIQELPERDRPREKLLAKGVAALSDRELLAVLLGRGSRALPLMKLADRVLKTLDSGSGVPEVAVLCELHGIGPARAAQLAAALELARRRVGHAGIVIRTALDILPFIRHYADRRQEHFLCVSLNGNNEIIATRVVTVGLLDRSQVHPREVFADPLSDRAAAVLVAHNHPSGSVLPSQQDKSTTRRLEEAGALLGIPLLDHLIFTHDDYFSFSEQGLL